MVSILHGKSVLVTGGTGSIGEALVRKALQSGARKIKVFSNDENGLYEMETTIQHNNKLEFLIGDIRDEERVNYAVKDVDIIFHAAALKHVDRCELNPFESITVNIIGTKNIITSALKEKVKKVISISTDKAVNPYGVMGATKLLAEKLVSAEAFHNNSTIFASVRFGNVLHTRGSIIPRIESQIKKGGPITLTDERMKRFFMTKEDAVNLIISATQLAKGGETFVLKMPIIRLKDLFEMMKVVLAPKYGYKSSHIKTKIIGIRPGEKLIEDLLTDYEMEHVVETKNFFIIYHDFHKNKRNNYSSTKESKNVKSYFNSIKPLSNKQILDMLKKIY
ncbi:SDR family NAD(P)-dependent oxidoreductase [Candidatus Pacearchaeota archaeon]|nr:SDR family NAD(P)-dependent oxidoreductase [Candidatus Pacearchaeota archaeon]